MNKVKYWMILPLMLWAFHVTARSGDAVAAGEVIRKRLVRSELKETGEFPV